MTQEEYLQIQGLRNSPVRNVIAGSELLDQRDRTLLYGYTVDRETVHVYLYKGEIFCVTFFFGETPEIKEISCNKDFVPNKRAYPEQCDHAFCELLIKNDVEISFTTFDEARAAKKTGKYMAATLPEHQ